jgi:hypothetical protein
MAEISNGGVFLPGASGSGKTTTLVRLADGALSCGAGLVVVDCKGSGLGGKARGLADRQHLKLNIVDPYSRNGLGYDPCGCRGFDKPAEQAGAAVANKLAGAFVYSGEAEVYKHAAMEVIAVIGKAMTAMGTEITLEGIYEALRTGGLARLGRMQGARKYRTRLADLDDSGSVGAAGYDGLRKRLGALMEGTYGELFARRPALNWREVSERQSVTYIALSATAAGEDSELFARVITQDLKLLCDERMRAAERGERVVPLLVCYDEFAALREAQQVTDLLLQARAASMPMLLATQFLPEAVPIRQPALSAGVLIAHRVEAEDANAIAAQFGTHRKPEITTQIDPDSKQSPKGSVRMVEEYNFHPDRLKALPVGEAAVLLRGAGRRWEQVRIEPL